MLSFKETGTVFPAEIKEVSATRANIAKQLPLSTGQHIKICLKEDGKRSPVNAPVGSSRASVKSPGDYHSRVAFAKADGLHF